MKLYSRDWRDVIAGGLMTVFGAWYAWYALSHYAPGSLARVGDGMFPAGLGIILTLLGLATAGGALLRPGPHLELRLRPALFVILGVAGFAASIRWFGLIPAILVVVIVSSLADGKVRPRGLMVLCVTLCVLSFLIFRVGLGLLIPMLDWPF